MCGCGSVVVVITFSVYVYLRCRCYFWKIDDFGICNDRFVIRNFEMYRKIKDGREVLDAGKEKRDGV